MVGAEFGIFPPISFVIRSSHSLECPIIESISVNPDIFSIPFLIKDAAVDLVLNFINFSPSKRKKSDKFCGKNLLISLLIIFSFFSTSNSP